jgi:hypothetical protein
MLLACVLRCDYGSSTTAADLYDYAPRVSSNFPRKTLGEFGPFDLRVSLIAFESVN